MREGAQPLAGIGVLKRKGDPGWKDKRHELLVVTARLGGNECKCLIDSGATHNFASKDWVERNHVTTIEEDKTFSVMFADGRQQESKTVKTACVNLRLGDFTWKDSLHVISISNYDLVLGKPWLSDYNPSIDFQSNVLTIMNGNKRYAISATIDPRPSVFTVTDGNERYDIPVTQPVLEPNRGIGRNDIPASESSPEARETSGNPEYSQTFINVKQARRELHNSSSLSSRKRKPHCPR